MSLLGDLCDIGRDARVFILLVNFYSNFPCSLFCYFYFVTIRAFSMLVLTDDII